MKTIRHLAVAGVIAIGLVSGATAQTETTTSTTTTAAPAVVVATDTDASQTRERFRELLERHPPQVGKVLKLDPTLFTNAAYLANYPALAAFVAQHPEVAHSPSFYLENVWVGDMRPESASERVWRDAVEGFGIFLMMGLVALVLSWIIRTLIQHRRWSRVSKVQAEVHNKLMDRFASNEELLAYIATPAGQRFLETAPLAVDTAQQSAGSPAGRILWSIQAGLVVAAAGIGLWLVSNNTGKEVAQPFFALGILALSVGIGFIVSSVVSLAVSRKLGLWTPPEPAAAND
jgi:hypothetical protein